MKYIKLLIFITICCSRTILGDQLPKERDERVEKMAQEGYKSIDMIFAHAQASIGVGEDVMDPAWFKRHKVDLQNVLSDSEIILKFDDNDENPIPELLQTYLQGKIRKEVTKLFGMHKVSVKDVEDFYELSHIVCDFSKGTHCGCMMREIEDENFNGILTLEMQKMARKQLRKQEARRLRKSLMVGTRQQQ